MTRLGLKRRIQDVWQKLSRIDARPDQIAAGFSIAIVASFLPLNPSPIAVGTAVAWLLKRNVIAAAAGGAMAIVFTPLLPLLWLAEYRLGQLILPMQQPPALDKPRLWSFLRDGWDVYAAMFVGSIIMAVPVAVLTYLIVKRLAERWARQKSEPLRSD